MSLPARALGRSDVRLSPITFGSMRLETLANDADWVKLLREALDRGVTTLHSSTEYDSFSRFTGIVRALEAGDRIQHVVKLAEPHFGDSDFDATRLVAKVDDYLTQLRAVRLDVVQWMWRGDLKNEESRLAGLVDRRSQLAHAFDELRCAGKIGAVAPFPYTQGFADRSIESSLFEGLTVYLNPVEQEMRPQIAAAVARGMGIVALRPFAAGKALASATPRVCIQSVLATAGVTTTVASFSSQVHLDELVSAT